MPTAVEFVLLLPAVQVSPLTSGSFVPGSFAGLAMRPGMPRIGTQAHGGGGGAG